MRGEIVPCVWLRFPSLARAHLCRASQAKPNVSSYTATSRTLAAVGFAVGHIACVLVGMRIHSRARRRRRLGCEVREAMRASSIEREAVGPAGWHVARSMADDHAAAVVDVVSLWRAAAKQTKLTDRQVQQEGFGVLAVPRKWATHLRSIQTEVMNECKWPHAVPFVAALSNSSALLFCTWVSSGGDELHSAPHAVFLGRKELDQISALALDPEIRRSNQLRINGTVYAAHSYFQREPQQVRSVLLFADLAAGAREVQRALALLDIAYPAATKAGLVVGREGQDPPLGLGGETCGRGGVLALLLPGPLHSAISLCGCVPIGKSLEVADADLKKGGFIRSVVSSEYVPDSSPTKLIDPLSAPDVVLPPRRQVVSAGSALRASVTAAGYSEQESVWVGVPRGSAHEEGKWRVGPGAGEWALYKWASTTVEGTVVLEGDGPGGDGLCAKGARRIQGFVSQPDVEAVGRLHTSFELERRARGAPGIPYATLLLAGGPGPALSIADPMLYDGCVFGDAVIGPAGFSLGSVDAPGAFSYSASNQRPTVVHRQAVCLLMLCA